MAYGLFGSRRAIIVKNGKIVAEAFYLAAHGGAPALGKANTIGRLEVGRDADLTLIDLTRVLPYNEHAAKLSLRM